MRLHGIPSKTNQPGIIVGNVRSPKHPSYQSHPFAPNAVRHSTIIPAHGDNTTDRIPPPPAAELNNVAKPDNTSLGPDDTDDGGMGTSEKILDPPESDAQSHSENVDVEVFVGHYQPSLPMGPFIPQPPDPCKEQKGGSNRRRNEMIECLRRARDTRSKNSSGHNDGSDGDDEDDDDDDIDSPDSSNDETNNVPKSPSSTTVNHPNSPTTPHRVFRSQESDSLSDSQSPSPRALAPTPKRKRSNSKSDPATPTQGQRVSKRQRSSVGDTPLPFMPPVKRTRAEQKKFQAKLNHLIFDQQRPGSVEREVVEIKSGAKEWKKTFLHHEPWDSSSTSE